ncbi:MAG: DUF5700 domain-containing putative Zn-dependent protease [Thermoplasmatota archaeon]
MNIDYKATELFSDYLDGDTSIDNVWETEAYKTIRLHADKLGGGLKKEQIVKAVEGENTGYYGVADLKENIDEIRNLIDEIKNNEKKWLKTIKEELDRVVPEEYKDDITIHPVFGFDIGIGLNDNVCINLNEQLFFDDPKEFMFIALHECSHVLYDRIHDFQSIDKVRSTEERITFFRTFFQTEGYAVYTPLNKRQMDEMKNLDHSIMKDYQIISDESKIKKSVKKYDKLGEELKKSGAWTLEKYMKKCFGQERLAYRVGGTLIKKIEEKEGMSVVRDGFYKDPDDFAEEFDWILDEYR